MLTEHDVIDAICRHLVAQGYDVSQRLAVTEKGFDIVARRPNTGRGVWIEAKGRTSASEGTPRFGQPFKTTQVFARVTDAFYMAAKMRSQSTNPAVVIGMAFADLPQYHVYIDAIAPVIRQLKFVVIFVDASRSISYASRSISYWDTASERSICGKHNG